MAEAKDVFGSNLEFGGAWTLDGAVLTFTIPAVKAVAATKATPAIVAKAAIESAELIVQGVNFAYKRPVNRLLSLTSSKQYMVSGRGMGQFSISAIMGPKDNMKAFIEAFSDICNVGTNILSLKPCANICDTEVRTEKTVATFNLLYCIIDSIAIQAQLGEMSFVSETITGIFGGLSMEYPAPAVDIPKK